MRSSHARLMVLGTAALALGALACTHDVTTAPRSAAGPSFVKSGIAGKVRTFHGSKGTFDIDHDRAVLKERASGREVALDKVSLARLERGFDGLDAMERAVAKLNTDPKFAGAMQRAQHSKKRVRLELDPTRPAPGVLASYSPRNGTTVAASGDDICTELELAIYYGTEVYQQLKQDYDDLIGQYYQLGWGFSDTGLWEFSYARFAGAFARWSSQIDVLAYKIVIQRNTLDYLALQYTLHGCWIQYAGAGGDTNPPDPGTGCKEMYARKQHLVNGEWVTYWEGTVLVCGDEI